MKVGLAEPRTSSGKEQLAEFIDTYIKDRTDAKPGTIVNLQAARKELVDFFGADKPLASITKGDAGKFVRWMTRSKQDGGRGLGKNTAGRVCGRAKQFFNLAIDSEMLERNPFDGQDSSVRGNKEKHFTITREMLAKLLEACHDPQWRLIILLSRIGGMRCPSEIMALRWSDINFDNNRMIVRSSKTERHEGKGQRIIPLFPELVDPLTQALADAPEGTEHVIIRYRDTSANLRTQFMRIIWRAGLKPWPQVIHNMRRSRQNELQRQFGTAVACEWIGNSAEIAREHYLHADDADFEKAIGTKAAHNAARSGMDSEGQEGTTIAKPAESPLVSTAVPSCPGGEHPRQDSNL